MVAQKDKDNLRYFKASFISVHQLNLVFIADSSTVFSSELV